MCDSAMAIQEIYKILIQDGITVHIGQKNQVVTIIKWYIITNKQMCSEIDFVETAKRRLDI